jgi:hypothetical protein
MYVLFCTKTAESVPVQGCLLMWVRCSMQIYFLQMTKTNPDKKEDTAEYR